MNLVMRSMNGRVEPLPSGRNLTYCVHSMVIQVSEEIEESIASTCVNLKNLMQQATSLQYAFCDTLPPNSMQCQVVETDDWM